MTALRTQKKGCDFKYPSRLARIRAFRNLVIA